MQKSLGNKRHELSEDNINNILDLFDEFEDSNNIKIFDNEDFDYIKFTVERPLQLNYQVSDDRLENIRYVNGFNNLIKSKKKDVAKKEKDVAKWKELQNSILSSLSKIQNVLYNSWSEFEVLDNDELGSFNLSPAFRKSIIMALSEHNTNVEYVTDNKGNKKPDSSLKDTEKIPLKTDIEEYFNKEVLKYYKDAWMNRSKDKVGYEINFTQYFYKYEVPRSLEDIEKDIMEITSEVVDLL